jgi:hypothetical protein
MNARKVVGWMAVVFVSIVVGLSTVGCTKQEPILKGGYRQLVAEDGLDVQMSFGQLWFTDGGKNASGTINGISIKTKAGKAIPVTLANESIENSEIQTVQYGPIRFRPMGSGGVAVFMTEKQLSAIKVAQ